MNSMLEKGNETAKNHAEKDLINSLPEDILNQILDYLPTKDAIRTSVLAHSWKNKWRSITHIDLHDDLTDLDRVENEKERAHSFLLFVNKVLQLISFPIICCFKLHLSGRNYNRDDLAELFSEVLKHGVQEFHIEYKYDTDAFPTSVFSCSSLISLLLDMQYCPIRVQSSVCLPNLQDLVLGGVQLQVEDDLFSDSKELVLNFHALKSFKTYRCDCSNVKVLSINAPLLETFNMDCSCFSFEHRDDDLDDELEPFAIKIHAPLLRDFSYQFISNEDIIFSNSSSIKKAYIGVPFDPYSDEDLYKISVKTGKLLEELNGVEHLKLHFDRFQVSDSYKKRVKTGFARFLSHVNNNLTTLPAFGSLIQLELILPRCLASQKILLNLIHLSPNLQTLVLNYAMTKFDNHLLLVEEVPHCFLHTLEAVEFTVPEIDDIIISLAKYVLQHSRVLKRMTISSSLKEANVIEKVNQVLLSSPKASSTLTVRVE